MYIYKITNLINGKCYVGQTTQPINIRFSQHCSDSKLRVKNKTYLHNAIKKYGRDNFKIEVLVECYSQKELNSKEIELIAQLKTLHPHGYNLRTGGKECGECSEETKKKISENRKGIYPKNTQSIKAIDINTNEQFFFIRCSYLQKYKINLKNVQQCLIKKRKSCFGYYWEYISKEEYETNKNNSLENFYPASKEIKSIKGVNKITQEEFFFEKISDLKKYGINIQNVGQLLRKERTAAVWGYFWFEISKKEYDQNKHKDLSNFKPSPTNITKQLKRINPTTGEEKIYNKISDIDLEGFKSKSIQKYIKNKAIHRGYIWEYVEENSI